MDAETWGILTAWQWTGLMIVSGVVTILLWKLYNYYMNSGDR